jgi:hypothetical protein
MIHSHMDQFFWAYSCAQFTALALCLVDDNASFCHALPSRRTNLRILLTTDLSPVLTVMPTPNKFPNKAGGISVSLTKESYQMLHLLKDACRKTVDQNIPIVKTCGTK